MVGGGSAHNLLRADVDQVPSATKTRSEAVVQEAASPSLLLVGSSRDPNHGKPPFKNEFRYFPFSGRLLDLYGNF